MLACKHQFGKPVADRAVLVGGARTIAVSTPMIATISISSMSVSPLSRRRLLVMYKVIPLSVGHVHAREAAL